MADHLTEQALSRESVLQGHFLRVVRDTVRLPDGATATREYVLHPGAVMGIPCLDDGRVVHRGAMAELAEDEGLQRRLLGLSLGEH